MDCKYCHEGYGCDCQDDKFVLHQEEAEAYKEYWEEVKKRDKDLMDLKLEEFKRIFIMNSSMMPTAGSYKMKSISREVFSEALKKSADTKKAVSNIGYPQNIRVILKMSNVRLDLNRSKIDLKDGDAALVMRLGYRATNKGAPVDEKDFEFFFVTYKSYKP